MKSKVSGINSLVLILVAFSSLLSMFALTRIDSIVHQDLYRYGLQFSYRWAMPYWTMTTLVFAMGWFNIIITCAFQFYVLLYARKEAEVIPKKEALKPEIAYQPPTEEAPAEEPEEEPVIVVEERGEEAEMLIEETQEEMQGPIEEVTPQEYVETGQPEEAEEQETEPTVAEHVEVEQEESYSPPTEAQPIDEERSEDTQSQVEVSQEETQPSTEDTQQQETELTEPYPT